MTSRDSAAHPFSGSWRAAKGRLVSGVVWSPYRDRPRSFPQTFFDLTKYFGLFGDIPWGCVRPFKETLRPSNLAHSIGGTLVIHSGCFRGHGSSPHSYVGCAEAQPLQAAQPKTKLLQRLRDRDTQMRFRDPSLD